MAFVHASPRTVSILKWTGIVLAVLLIAILVLASLVDMKGPVERFASARLDRPVEITGDVEVHPWSLSPGLIASGVQVGNADWDVKQKKLMADIERIELRVRLLPLLKGDVILPYVMVGKPQVYAHRDASGRANWDFGRREEAAERRADPAELPVVQRLIMDDGKLEIRDDVRKLVFRGTVRARQEGAKEEGDPFLLEGKGELNGRAFEAKATGGSLISLDAGEPYPFKLAVRADDIRVNADGVVPKPFDMAKLSLKIRASGNDMADLYYLTGLVIPNTPPYDVAASVQRDGAQFAVHDIEGAFGRSDVHGDLEIDTAAERPKVSGKLSSQVVNAKDITAMWGMRRDPETSPTGAQEGIAPAPAGAPPQPDATAAATGDASEANGNAAPASDQRGAGDTAATSRTADGANPAATPAADTNEADGPVLRVFPDARLQANRVRGMDADVEYDVETIETGNVPFEKLAVHVALNAGMLELDPLTLTLPQGKVAGFARIDARKDVPHTEIDLRIGDVDLAQFKRAADENSPLAGHLQARVVAKGDGASMHEFVSHASGTLTAVVPHGEVRESLAELTGINVLRGIGLLLAEDETRTEIRCGVANFEIEDGVMQAKHVVLDTDQVLITGSGEVRFGPEELDLELKGNPKEFRLVSLDAPIGVGGHLRQPSIRVEAGGAAKQIGVGVALSAIIAPIATLFAFVDTGLAEDANCAALLASAQDTEAPPPASANDVDTAAEPGT